MDGRTKRGPRWNSGVNGIGDCRAPETSAVPRCGAGRRLGVVEGARSEIAARPALPQTESRKDGGAASWKASMWPRSHSTLVTTRSFQLYSVLRQPRSRCLPIRLSRTGAHVTQVDAEASCRDCVFLEESAPRFVSLAPATCRARDTVPWARTNAERRANEDRAPGRSLTPCDHRVGRNRVVLRIAKPCAAACGPRLQSPPGRVRGGERSSLRESVPSAWP